MKNIIRRLLFFIILFIDLVVGQIAPIEEGSAVPSITINNVFNYTRNDLNIADFKGKLVILDFWGFNCGSCIKAFPKMDSLQKKYKDKIQILLVNTETRSATDTFFQKRKFIKKPDLPFITSDTLLNELFPHTAVPHHIWIDEKGRLYKSAQAYHLTEKNIESFFKGENLDIPSAKMTTYHTSIYDTTYEKTISFSSSLARCQDEGATHFDIAPAPGLISLGYCYSAVQLFQIAFDETTDLYQNGYARPGLTVTALALPYKYIRPQDPDSLLTFLQKYSYYYHLRLPPQGDWAKYEYMRGDLHRYFSLVATVEKRDVKSVVLRRTSNDNKLGYKKGEEEFTFFDINYQTYDLPKERTIRKAPYRGLSLTLKALIEANMNVLFIDETGYKSDELIDISVPASVRDKFSLFEWNKALKKYDLELLEKVSIKNVLVIKDAP